jgi:[ribosomal protein S5]-alanine N-acetyltransferase
MNPQRGRVLIRTPRRSDEAHFLDCVRRSRSLHRPWVIAPSTSEKFRDYLGRVNTPTHVGFLVCLRDTGDLAGVVNLSEIVRGCFLSAYLGYYAFTPHAGQGAMREGLGLVIAWAFRELRLHRLEANIQPANLASINLVRRLGFRKEGLSPRYLKIGSRWQDHERWAILAEDWRGGRTRR